MNPLLSPEIATYILTYVSDDSFIHTMKSFIQCTSKQLSESSHHNLFLPIAIINERTVLKCKSKQDLSFISHFLSRSLEPLEPTLQISNFDQIEVRFLSFIDKFSTVEFISCKFKPHTLISLLSFQGNGIQHLSFQDCHCMEPNWPLTKKFRMSPSIHTISLRNDEKEPYHNPLFAVLNHIEMRVCQLKQLNFHSPLTAEDKTILNHNIGSMLESVGFFNQENRFKMPEHCLQNIKQLSVPYLDSISSSCRPSVLQIELLGTLSKDNSQVKHLTVLKIDTTKTSSLQEVMDNIAKHMVGCEKLTISESFLDLFLTLDKELIPIPSKIENITIKSKANSNFRHYHREALKCSMQLLFPKATIDLESSKTSRHHLELSSEFSQYNSSVQQSMDTMINLFNTSRNENQHEMVNRLKNEFCKCFFPIPNQNSSIIEKRLINLFLESQALDFKSSRWNVLLKIKDMIDIYYNITGDNEFYSKGNLILKQAVDCLEGQHVNYSINSTLMDQEFGFFFSELENLCKEMEHQVLLYGLPIKILNRNEWFSSEYVEVNDIMVDDY